jgi:hypothetical protein
VSLLVTFASVSMRSTTSCGVGMYGASVGRAELVVLPQADSVQIAAMPQPATANERNDRIITAG